MKYQHTYTLTSMRNDADRQLRETGERLDKQIHTLDERLGYNSYGSLSGAVFFTLVWTAVCIFAGVLLADSMPGKTYWLVLAPTLLLVATMLLREVLTFRYFGALLSARGRLDRLRGQISSARSSLVSDFSQYMACEKNNWRMPLSVGANVQAETERVDNQLAGMQAVSVGGLSGFANVLYYTSCIAWAVASFFFLFEAGESILSGLDFDADANRVILIICAVLAAIATIILARLLWAATGNQVTNVTLFGLAIGPVAFFLVLLLAFLIVGLVSILLSVAAVIIGGIILYTCVSGG